MERGVMIERYCLHISRSFMSERIAENLRTPSDGALDACFPPDSCGVGDRYSFVNVSVVCCFTPMMTSFFPPFFSFSFLDELV